ncbi:MAG: hypothetical protein A3J75_08620 [Acidobacteria bacterium RBG_16_68_9]|nr:MAG: hypothetical protein A3J75_08620 [Acidobacteria bacterium RBG_16_68_9]
MKRRMRHVPLALAALALIAVARDAAAHSLDPALLDVREGADGTTLVTWKTSAQRIPGSRTEPVLPPSCRTVRSPEITDEGARITVRWTVDCRPGGLVGQQIGVDGLGLAKIDALVRVILADGRLVRGVVRARDPFLTIPERPRRFDVLRDYIRLGVEHILGGPDHLLFVFGLLLLVITPRLLVRTVTAFTIGHSLTLTAAVFDLVRVPPALAELLISISVLVLAVELARDATQPTLMRRKPWAMAAVFGLLHGLGFAGGLRAIGLPGSDIPVALFAFNVGVEIGQISFIAVVLALRWGLEHVPARWPRWAAWVPVYSIGILAAFWCFERTAALMQ